MFRARTLEFSHTPRSCYSKGSKPSYAIEFYANDSGMGWEVIVDDEYTLGCFEHLPQAMAEAQNDYNRVIMAQVEPVWANDVAVLMELISEAKGLGGTAVVDHLDEVSSIISRYRPDSSSEASGG